MQHTPAPSSFVPRSSSLLLAAAVAALALAPACSSSETSPTDTGVGPTDSGIHPDAAGTDAAREDARADAGPEDTGTAPNPDATPGPDAMTPDTSTVHAEDCDPIMPEACALPWPSNLYLVPDNTRETGFTLSFGATSLPENVSHVRIDPAIFRRMDGYGVGEPVIVLFPNLDASALPNEEQLEQSMAADAKILLFEAGGATLTRIPYFAELDSTEPDATKKVLFVRPAVLLHENTRYIVAFRNLVDQTGHAIAPSEAFAKLVAGDTDNDPLLAPRQALFNDIFAALEGENIQRSSLLLAWDFHTASSSALHGRMLAMRDAAYANVGSLGPELTITGTTAFIPSDDGSGRPVDPDIAYEFTATMVVPKYLRTTFAGILQGTVLNLGADNLPVQNGHLSVDVWIRVPYSAVTSTVPHNLMQYGHGLLGSGDEVEGGYLGRMANQHHLVLFACNWMGMAAPDMQAVGAILGDLNVFPFLGDTLHQGILNALLLARAMKGHFASLPEVRSKGIVIDTSEVYYSGNSQGGIFGATYMALSKDVARGHLGVPGQNYSTLLYRSVDFTTFFSMLQASYPSHVDEAIGLSLIQLLWNETDPVSYYRHITASPFPGDQAHAVIATVAKGDHQVAPLTMEIVGRSDVEVPIMEHYDNQRTVYGVTEATYPRSGSGIVLYDFGNPWPTPGNHVPEDTMSDPHGLPRRLAEEQDQVTHFFRTGVIIDVCGGDGCHPN